MDETQYDVPVTVLQLGKVYEVMRKHGQYNWALGMARADVVDGQEVLVGAYDWKTRRPVSYTPLHQIGITGRIFTPEELANTGFGKLFSREEL